MSQITVIGAGTMGNGIAHAFAQYGHDVHLVDTDASALERARATIARNLERQVTKARLSAADRDATLARLTMSSVLAKAVTAAELVVEAATENPDVKLALFRESSTRTRRRAPSSRPTPPASRSRTSPRPPSARAKSSGCTS